MTESFRRPERPTQTTDAAPFADVAPAAFICAAGGGLHHNNGSQHPGDTPLYTVDVLVAELDNALTRQSCTRTLWDEIGGLRCVAPTPHEPGSGCSFASSDAPDRHTNEPTGHGGHR